MLSFTQEKKDCTGCTACYSICPVSCIDMVPDTEGFLYPVASSACVDCGKCMRVCPIYNFCVSSKSNKKMNQLAYAAVSNDKNIWKRSASGGAFSEICRAWDDGNTIYVGAAFEGLYVHHISVNGFNSIAPLCKSKYVESSLEETFLTLKEHLDAGKRVLFCGTPCQVAGLRAYVGRDCENLLLLDLICHGVGSPKVFETCMHVTGKQIGGIINSYQFRAKRSVFEADHLQRVRHGNGKYVYLEDDPYMQLYLTQHCLRPSCGENCKYRNEFRQGDLTIADFKGFERIFPDLIGGKRNFSTIVFNNEKSMFLIRELEKTMKLYKCSLDEIREYNPLFYKQTWFSERRDSFFNEYTVSPEATIERWTKPAKVRKLTIKRILWNILPTLLRKWIINHVFLKRGG